MKRVMQMMICMFIFAFVSMNCSAAELIAGVEEGDRVRVSGGAVAAESANIVVVHSAQPAPYTAATSFAAIKVLPTDKDGTVGFAFQMPDESKSGYYDAVITDNGVVSTQRFYYLNKKTADAALTAFSSFDSEAKIENGFTIYSEELGLASDISDPALDMGKLAGYFLKYKPAGTMTVHSFAKAYLGAKLSSMICSETYDIDSLVGEMQNNSYYLDCSEHRFLALPREEQQAVLKQFAKRSLSSKSFFDALEEARFLTNINSAETQKDFNSVLKDFNAYLQLDTTDYQELKSPEKVVESLMAKYLDNGFSSVSQFKAAFASSVADCAAAEGRTKLPSGRGGGKTTSYETLPGDNITPNEPPASTDAVFKDVSEHWGKAAIEALYKKGIVSGVGDGRFEPERGVTRAEFAKMTAQAFFADIDTYASVFDDVPPQEWYARGIGVLADKKIINGVSDGAFAPGAMMTREDAAVIMSRAAGVTDISLEKTRESIRFGDDSFISDYARAAVYTLYEAKLLSGTGNDCFNPKGIVTRAEAAQMLYNMLQQKEVK